MSLLLGLLLAYGSLALQATLVPWLEIGGIRPDLPLIATVALAIGRGRSAGMLFGFFVGLGQDVTNPAFLGLNALAKTLVGYGVGSVRHRLDARTRGAYAAMLLVATLVHDVVYLTVYTRLSLSEVVHDLATRSLPTGLYSAAVGLWLVRLLVLVGDRRGRSLGHVRFAGR